MSERYEKVLVNPDLPLKDALKKMNKTGLQVLIAVDEKRKILGILTDGDVRRAILGNVSFSEPVKSVMNKKPVTITCPPDKSKALKLMRKYQIRHLPVVTGENKVVGLLLWKDFIENGEANYSLKTSPVVIMAGGRGTRLSPFTKILPKPLVPIGEKPIIELIMDNFKKYGFYKFLISLNYKGDMIKMYFSENTNGYRIEYIEENNYLGTAGALSLARDRLKETFILSNCDVIIDANFDSLLKYHKENKNKVTILAVIRRVRIPYGVLKIQNATLDEIVEKPEYCFIVNSGVYVMEPEIVELIPKNKSIDMPDLLLLAKREGFKVQVYLVSCSWFDVGEWEEYRKAAEYIKKYG